MTIAPALIVVAHSRPNALQRLLRSLAALDVPMGMEVPLVISIDGDNPDVFRVAEAFEWISGSKRTMIRTPSLGLRGHVLVCGDLVDEFGSVIVLEDDLLVSNDLMHYALASREQYERDSRIAGVAMYAMRMNNLSGLPFFTLDDGHDAYFSQFPCSSGQMWTYQQWSRFRAWYDQAASEGVDFSHGVPRGIANWSESSWKKYLCRYLVEQDLWLVYPRQGVTSNSGDPGTHLNSTGWKHISYVSRGRRRWSFPQLVFDSVRYDAWLEPHPEMLEARWPDYDWSDVTIDFHGLKKSDEIRTSRRISIGPCADTEFTFPLMVLPVENNLDLPNAGTFFSLGSAKSFPIDDNSGRIQLINALGAHISESEAEQLLQETFNARNG